jgi:hypothetical protein
MLEFFNVEYSCGMWFWICLLLDAVLKRLLAYKGVESFFDSSREQNLLLGLPTLVYGVPGAHSLGVEWLECVKLPPRLHFVLMLRMSSAIYIHPSTPVWNVEGQL